MCQNLHNLHELLGVVDSRQQTVIISTNVKYRYDQFGGSATQTDCIGVRV